MYMYTCICTPRPDAPHEVATLQTASPASGESAAPPPCTPSLRYKIPVFSDPDPGKS